MRTYSNHRQLFHEQRSDKTGKNPWYVLIEIKERFCTRKNATQKQGSRQLCWSLVGRGQDSFTKTVTVTCDPERWHKRLKERRQEVHQRPPKIPARRHKLPVQAPRRDTKLLMRGINLQSWRLVPSISGPPPPPLSTTLTLPPLGTTTTILTTTT